MWRVRASGRIDTEKLSTNILRTQPDSQSESQSESHIRIGCEEDRSDKISDIRFRNHMQIRIPLLESPVLTLILGSPRI